MVTALVLTHQESEPGNRQVAETLMTCALADLFIYRGVLHHPYGYVQVEQYLKKDAPGVTIPYQTA